MKRRVLQGARRVLLLLVATPLWALAAEAEPQRAWSLRRPAVEKVVFRGMVSYDNAGMGAGTMLYPAPSAAGLLAAILTHSLLNEGAKKAQKDKLQADADATLLPYETVLSTFTHERLFADSLIKLKQAAPRRVLGPDEAADSDWLIEAGPVFSMTPDQRAIVLDNAIRIVPPGGGEAVLMQTIRVVSLPLAIPAEPGASAPGPSSLWLIDQGARLADESAAVFAESIAIAMMQAKNPEPGSDVPQKTFRFVVGGTEKMERGQLVDQRCDRVLIRTLRGHLMSVPAPADACAAEPAS
jgi:hypothetical protein